MPCYTPLKAWQRHSPGASGKRAISFSQKDVSEGGRVELPCGQCIGCRLERGRQWAVRIMHEASMHRSNCFLTLTYKEEPPGGSLNLYDITTFLKRLRFAIAPHKVRFYQVGEYGPKLQRPHHHMCLFGYDFPDKWLHSSAGDCHLYRSDELERLWPHGFSTIGELNYQTAAYVARYVTKKITGPSARGHYGDKKPEFSTMSRKPGIGASWYQQWKGDIFPADELVIMTKTGPRRSKIPRFYSDKLEKEDPVLLQKLKQERREKALKNINNLPANRRRIHAYKIVRQRQLNQRSYEQS